MEHNDDAVYLTAIKQNKYLELLDKLSSPQQVERCYETGLKYAEQLTEEDFPGACLKSLHNLPKIVQLLTISHAGNMVI